MSSINYFLIQKESIKSYFKNFPYVNLLGLILTAVPLLIAYATFATSSNRIFYFLAAIPLLLLLIVSYYYFYKLSLDATNSKVSFGNLKFQFNNFSHFIINQFMVVAAVFVSAIPMILAGLVFGVAFYDRIAPYDKLNLSFNDIRAALGGIYIHFYAFLLIFLVNLPFVFYTILRVGFSGFYTIQNDSTSIAAIHDNIADTKQVDLVDGFGTLLVFLIFDIGIFVALFWIGNIIAQGQFKSLPFNIVAVLIPLVLIPIFGLQLATMFKKLSARNLLV